MPEVSSEPHSGNSGMPADGLKEFLFSSFSNGSLHLPNRIVMAPMTRSMSPGNIPGPDVAAYYARRARHGVGLIVTEGVTVDHPLAGRGDASGQRIPDFHSAQALDGWRAVVDAVHAAGGKIAPQLWHMGLSRTVSDERSASAEAIGPSGLLFPSVPNGRPMSHRDVDNVVAAFARGAETAWRLGFDAVAVHGAHGYLLDLFLWEETNQRRDRYGGTPADRARFASEIVAAMRAATPPDFPIIFRFSQWKTNFYDAHIAGSPGELEELLCPIADAGVSIFDCSTRMFWEPAFQESDLGLAGWTRKLTGRPTITVGGVGLSSPMYAEDIRRPAKAVGMDRLSARAERGEFDLVGVGRGLVADARWVEKVRDGQVDQIHDYTSDALATLA